MRVTVEPASVEHVLDLMGRLRESDRQEIRAAIGTDPDKALFDSFNHSLVAWAVLRGKEVIAIFGAVPTSLCSHTARVWFLGSDAVDEEKQFVARITRPYTKKCLTLFRRLENWIDDRNETSAKWLAWSGYTVEPPAPYGVEGRPFRHFYIDRS